MCHNDVMHREMGCCGTPAKLTACCDSSEFTSNSDPSSFSPICTHQRLSSPEEPHSTLLQPRATLTTIESRARKLHTAVYECSLDRACVHACVCVCVGGGGGGCLPRS